jgi:hypothetical protein
MKLGSWVGGKVKNLMSAVTPVGNIYKIGPKQRREGISRICPQQG